MEKEANNISWLGRARFSKTIHHNRSYSFDSIREMPVSSNWSKKDPVFSRRKSLSSESVKGVLMRKKAEGEVMGVDQVNRYLVDRSEFVLGDRFARGAFSIIYHGRYKGLGVAIKVVESLGEGEDYDGRKKILNARLEKQFSREVELLAKLHHPNVIELVGECRKPPYSYILTEYLPNGSLRSYLHKLEIEKQRLSLEETIVIALGIARGMEYVHSQHVIHRDLKPENVLIGEARNMKIADFGIGCHEDTHDSFADEPGTYRWMAPEMIKSKSGDLHVSLLSRKVDVYSFGLILWELVSGSVPYPNLEPIQVAFAVLNKNERPTFPEDCPAIMRTIIEQCWSSQPNKRPEFSQLVEILEQCEASLATNGTLDLVPESRFQERDKGFCNWMQKLNPAHCFASHIHPHCS